MQLDQKILIPLAACLAIIAVGVFWYVRVDQPRDLQPPSQDTLSGRRDCEKPSPTSPVPGLQTSRPISASVEAATSDSQLRSGLDLEVPFGAKVPAALMDAGSPDDGPEMQEILDSITSEFIAAIEVSRRIGRNPEEAWDEALRVADEKYKLFFGQDAFSEAGLEAGIEALEDGASQSTPSTP